MLSQLHEIWWDTEQRKLRCWKNGHRKILSKWHHVLICTLSPYVDFCLFFVSRLLSLSPSDVLFEWPLRLCFLFMQEIKPEYKTNLQKLKNFVMVKFAQDTMVDPKESEVRYCLYCLSLFIWIIYAYSIKFTFFLILVVRLLQTRASCGMSNPSREWNLYAGILFLYCFRRLNFLSWPSLLCRRNVLLSFL